jgi:hypothetical protein
MTLRKRSDNLTLTTTLGERSGNALETTSTQTLPELGNAESTFRLEILTDNAPLRTVLSIEHGVVGNTSS